MHRRILWTSALALHVVAAAPPCIAAQPADRPTGLSAEVGVGPSLAGHGGGFSGKAVIRIHPGSGDWVIGVRAIAADGVRRTATNCFFFCEPIESVTEAAALLYRAVPISDSKSVVYVGAGIGHLSGHQFIGSSSELEDISNLGLSIEAALHAPRSGFRLALAAHGHVGPNRPLAGVTIGIGFGR